MPSGPAAQAFAEAAAIAALEEMAQMRDAGREVLDEGDFIARAVQQAFMEREAAGGDA